MEHRRALALSFLVIVIAVSIHPVRADWVFVQRTYDATFNISPSGYHYVYAYRLEDYKEQIDFTCLSGGNRDVYFYIFDEENFDLWNDGYSSTCYIRQDAVVSWTGEFQFPHSDTYYYVFSNLHSLYSDKTVQLTIDLYQWQDVPPPDLAWINLVNIVTAATFIGIIIAVVVVAVVLVNHFKQAPPSLSPTSTTAPGQPLATRRFCPTCGKPLEGAAIFCSNCGNKLS